MIITIQGKQGEGKTTLAKKICKGKKVSFIDEHSLKSPFWTSQIDNDTDFILVDDVKNYEETYSIFRAEILTVNRQCKESFDMKMPDVILVRLHGVVKSLPTEQCVRDWWREGTGDEHFWKHETDWSNEQVFREIYQALTYFII